MNIQTLAAEQIAKLPAVMTTSAEYEALYREDMLGCIASIHLDLLTHSAIVTTAGGCVDMTGCIATLMMLDPQIADIQTIDGRALVVNNQGEVTGTRQAKDTQYIRDPRAGWRAIRWDRTEPSQSEGFGTAFVVKRLQALLLAALRATKEKLAPPPGCTTGRTGKTDIPSP